MNAKATVVLHVDDDSNDLFLFREAWRKAQASFVLESVNDGEKAIAYLSGAGVYADRERYPLPTLVLLDLKMPRQTGFEVLDWIRHHPDLKRLPVAVLTSSQHDLDINLAYEKGANSYLVKPVNFDALLELVKIIDRYWLQLNTSPEG